MLPSVLPRVDFTSLASWLTDVPIEKLQDEGVIKLRKK